MHIAGYMQGNVCTRCLVRVSVSVRVGVALRLEVYRQLVRLVDKPVEAHGQRLFVFATSLSR
jgi:hypothetical protein